MLTQRATDAVLSWNTPSHSDQVTPCDASSFLTPSLSRGVIIFADSATLLFQKENITTL